MESHILQLFDSKFLKSHAGLSWAINETLEVLLSIVGENFLYILEPCFVCRFTISTAYLSLTTGN